MRSARAVRDRQHKQMSNRLEATLPSNTVKKHKRRNKKRHPPVASIPVTRAQHNWRKALNAVRSNLRLDNHSPPLLGVSGTAYHLEKLDPQHRRGVELEKQFNIWKESNTENHFFPWLDERERVTHHHLPRMVYRTTLKDQEKLHAVSIKDRLFIDTTLCNTTQYRGKHPRFASYVLLPNKQLFLTEHKADSDVHASLTGGQRVAAAGMMCVQQGKITEINNFSGHYQPALKNLLYAVKSIPENCFAPDAKVVYLKQRFPDLANKLKDSSYGFIRSAGRWLSRQHKQTTFSRSAFITFAEKEQEKTSNKFIYKRDKKDNRYENTLFESSLAKCVIENDHTWRSLILKINQWIYDQILAQQSNKKIVNEFIKFLKINTMHTNINHTNFLDIAREYLLESPDLFATIHFHKTFFEDIYPKINPETSSLPLYQTLRTPDLFDDNSRGISGNRALARYKHPFYRSNALGIMPDEETPASLSNFFANKPGDHQPCKRFHKLNGERTSYMSASLNRETKTNHPLTYREEVIARDISLVSGAAGTPTKVLPPLIHYLKLTKSEINTYFMVSAAAITAFGHHSIYEVMVLKRKLGIPIEYNHRFYHEHLLTRSFKKSAAYKKFLATYSDEVKAHIPKPSDQTIAQHETYLKVKKIMESKKTNRSESKSTDVQSSQANCTTFTIKPQNKVLLTRVAPAEETKSKPHRPGR